MSQTIDYIKTSDDFKTYIQKNPFLMNHLTRPKTNFLIENDYPNFRAYKDESTNIYNKIFFNNKKMLHYFLYFCYHQINYDIMTNINISLIKINTILKSSEEIFLISNGGNIITLYINKFLNKLSKENVNTIKENTKLGSISDTDLTIYLLTEDEYRFNLIYSQLSPILYSSCEKISNFFDEKIEFKKNRNTPNKSTILNNPNYLIIDKKKYSLIDIHQIDKNISENIENNSIDSINEAKNIIKDLIFKDKKFVIMDDIYIGTRYIKILQTIKYYRNLLNFNINIDNIISYQKKIFLTIT